VNADHVRDLVAPVNLPLAWPAGRFSLPQSMDQLISQLIDGQRVDGTVDHFSADVGVSKVKNMHVFELAGDLFGRQALTQHVQDQGEPKSFLEAVCALADNRPGGHGGAFAHVARGICHWASHCAVSLD
jgi:hypothetical protein